MKRCLVLAGLATIALPCMSARADERPSLKEAFADHFRVGVAVGTHHVMGDEPAALKLATNQFNSITSENLLKWAEVHPERDRYNFEPADKFVDFGQKHGMFIVGHTLVWHNQTPSWVFEDESGTPLDRDGLLERMGDHIHAVVGRFKGRIQAWDVVNEAFEDDGRLRESPWKRIIGDDYLEHAFRFAHEADPEAELYYNDFNEWHAGKRQAIARLVRSLQAKGVRIDGVGMQGHWGMDYPSLEELDATIGEYGDLGVKVMITELDLNFLPRPDQQQGAEVARNFEAREALNPYAKGLPEEVAAAAAARYAELFRLLVKHDDVVDRVTFWGVHDGHSWLNNWPIRGRTAYPLLFDRKLQPKPALDAVLSVATKADE